LKQSLHDGTYSPTAAQAKEEVLAMIPQGVSVYRCGSVTASGMGIWEGIAEIPGVRIIDPFKPDLTPEESQRLRREGLSADVMIASTNAITLDGRLVNLDGTGNRVAALAYGPQKVILVVGMNKVAPDLESAMDRVKHYAAPVNAMRIGFDTPCAQTGLCIECRAPQRTCNVWSIIEGQRFEGRIHVMLVGENLGY
jgi:hypothetical protein